MKKLIIAAAIVCAAAFAQAASVSWMSSGSFYDIKGEPGGWGLVAEGTTAYFLFANDYSQSALVSDFAAGTIDTTKLNANETGTIASDGTIAKVTGSETALTGFQNAYVALFEDGNLFISDVVPATIDQMTGADYLFEEDQTGNIWANWGDAKGGYQGAGWYTASAVPEPTSGLLLLLGVAGLALKRKRA